MTSSAYNTIVIIAHETDAIGKCDRGSQLTAYIEPRWRPTKGAKHQLNGRHTTEGDAAQRLILRQMMELGLPARHNFSTPPSDACDCQEVQMLVLPFKSVLRS
jgi:hypothetical protein